jgi:hypothetical protein
MHRFLAIFLLSLLAACGRSAVVEQALADFKKNNPQWVVAKAYFGKGDSDHVYVYIHYVATPAAAFPSKPSIYEMKLGYRKTDGRWIKFSEQGSRYVGPAR